jgi:hypothetical protein
MLKNTKLIYKMEYYQESLSSHRANYHNYSYDVSNWVSQYNKAMFPVFLIQKIIKAILLVIILKLWG